MKKVVFAALLCASSLCAQVQLGRYVQIGGSIGSSQQFNYEYYPGAPGGSYTTIQLAVTAACAAYGGNGTVVLQQGATPGDTITDATGCEHVYARDEQGGTFLCYAWTMPSGPYALQDCGTGGGGGSVPTGTGFYHVTSGTMDSAARAVNLASGDVTGVLPSANMFVATSSTPGAVKPDNTTISVSAGVITAIPNGHVYVHTVTPDAEWAFPQGATSLVTEPDVSGSNACSGAPCDATFTGVGFTRLPGGGLQMFNDGGVTSAGGYLDTAITTWRSMLVRACQEQYAQNTVSVGAPVYMGFWGTGPGASTGVNAMVGSNPVGGDGTFFFAPSLYDTATWSTWTDDITGGCQTYVYTLDTDGRFYKNGVEETYGAQAAPSTPTVTGGTYVIGSSINTGTQHNFTGTIMYEEVWLTHVLTPAEALAETQYVEGKAGLDPYTAVIGTSTTSSIPFNGDSITLGNGATPYTTFLSLDQTYNIYNWGSGGDRACQVATNHLYRSDINLSVNSPRSKVSFFLGTNDVANGDSPLKTWGCLKKNIQAELANGALVMVSTMLDRTTLQTDKNELNTYIRNEAPKLGDRVFIVDNAENPDLGADGAATNATYFQGDEIHPTTAGQMLIADGYSIAINTADGSSVGNPDITTSNAYVAASANNYVIQTPTTAATYTLTTCGYITGYYKTVVNGSASNTITVGTTGSETLVGTAAVDPLTTGVFQSVLIGPTTGGCFWQRIATGGSGVGTGTVTSVDQTVPSSLLTVSGGPITNSGTLALGLTAAPAYSLWGNPTGSSGAPDYTDTPSLLGLDLLASASSGVLNLINTTAATGSVNQDSAIGTWEGSIWNGTSATTDIWQALSSMGAGTNPTTTLTFQHASGSSGAAKVQVPNLIVAGQTGSTQCAQFDTNGNLTGFGSGCVGDTSTQTLTNKRITERVGTTTSSGTPTINTDNVDAYIITAQAAAITSFTTNLSGTPTNGQQLIISVTDNGTARAETWGTGFESSNFTLPTTTTVNVRQDNFFIWDAATSKWRLLYSAGVQPNLSQGMCFTTNTCFSSAGAISSNQKNTFAGVTVTNNVLVATSLAVNTATKTSSYTLGFTDHTVYGDATTGALTLTLINATASTGGTGTGWDFSLCKKDSSVNAVTVSSVSSQTISGRIAGVYQSGTTLSLAVQGQCAELESDGSNWFILSSN